MILVVIILVIFLGNVRGAIHRRDYHSVRVAVRFHLPGPAAYFGQPAVPGRAGFRHGRGRRGGDGGKHRAPSEPAGRRIRDIGAIIRGRRTKCSGRCSTPLPSSSRPTFPSSRCSRSEGKLFRPMAWTVAFALLGALDLLHADCAGAGELLFPEERQSMANPVMEFVTARYRRDGRLGGAHNAG
jgi:hypothetical protein